VFGDGLEEEKALIHQLLPRDVQNSAEPAQQHLADRAHDAAAHALEAQPSFVCADAPAGWATWSTERRAAALDARKGATSEAVSAQNGMPITVARSFDGVVASALLRYYAALAGSMPGEELRTGLPRGTTLVRREPAGVVAAIMTWNFPQTTAFFKVAPRPRS
jgi:acyl-CoA reductase-like NAD-dependent aldehyde dehydrogenase